MHGAGNDYIYVNTLKYPIESPEKLSVEWSAPHTGIGSDGLVKLGILKGDVDELIAQNAHRPFFMHGLSHWLGLDVHDVGVYGQDRSRILELEATAWYSSAVQTRQISVCASSMRMVPKPKCAATPVVASANTYMNMA